MPFTFTMPKLSPTMDEGVIAKWHKKEGDLVKAGDVLLEITTDKATVEHQSLDEGYLRKILVPNGKTAKVNQPIAVLSEDQSENIDDFLKSLKGPEKEKRPEKREAKEKVEEKEPEREAVSMGVPAFVPEPPLEKYKFRPQEEKERQAASPYARKLARERNLDLATVRGSGPGGRIVSEDLTLAAPASFLSFDKREIPDVPAGSYEEIALSPMRKTIAKRLQESKTFIPHFYIKETVDAEPLVQLRQQLKALELHVTFNDLMIKAAALALRKHPEVNTGFNSVNQTIIQFKTVDISVAVSINEGLITPIVRYADYKNLGQIAQEVRLLSEKAKAGKLQPEEFRGGSFCVSNLGMFGIKEFLAVINPPQAAILAIGGIKEEPVVKNGALQAGKTLQLTLSCDHRVIDGALAATFLKTLQLFLENPVSLVL